MNTNDATYERHAIEIQMYTAMCMNANVPYAMSIADFDALFTTQTMEVQYV